MTEQEFAKRWWYGRFPAPILPPTPARLLSPTHWTCSSTFAKPPTRNAGMNAKDKLFLESWWQRRFSTADPLKWDSFMTLADAEDLLVQYRNSANTLRPAEIRRAS